MSQTEEDLTRYELIQAKKAYIQRLDDELETGRFNSKQEDFLKQYKTELVSEIEKKSSFTLDEAVEELGFCYDVGTRIRHIIASHISEKSDNEYSNIHEMYSAWHMSVYFVFLKCEDINNHYIAIFTNAFNRNNKIIPTVKEQADLIMGKTKPTPEKDFDSLNYGIDKLEELIFRLEEKQNLVARQKIAKQEHDSSSRYWLRYDDIAGKLYLNGNVLIASTRLDSPADRLLQQAFAQPDNLIELDGITSVQVSSALRDLNIKGNLKKIFFPRTSGNKILFRPKITNTEFAKEEHKDISITEFTRKNEK